MIFSWVLVRSSVGIRLTRSSTRLISAKLRSRAGVTQAAHANLGARFVEVDDGSGDFAKNNALTKIKGIGPKTLDLLSQLNIHTMTDLLLHFPRSIVDRSKIVYVEEGYLGQVVTVEGIVENAKEGFRNQPCVVQCKDPRGTRFSLTYFFGGHVGYLWNSMEKNFSPGASIVVSGKLSRSSFNSKFDFVNPEFALDKSIVGKASLEKLLVVEPKYGQTEGLTSSKLRGFVNSALEGLKQEPHKYFSDDWIPADFRSKKGWPTMLEAIHSAHSPRSIESLDPSCAWRERLAFDELVSMQLSQIKRQTIKDAERERELERKRRREMTGQAADQGQEQDNSALSYTVKGTGLLTSILVETLPFTLTNCQRLAVAEIWDQMSKPERMVRCVQGDVGSGKTLVAVMAMLRAVEDGKQAALLAPTEILAKQHMLVISRYFETIKASSRAKAAGKSPSVALITASIQGLKRKQLLDDLSSGKIDILIGTHALLAERVSSSFSSLGLVVIDEEQRFGVSQRDVLGDLSNVLYTTATPIPRSLMMVVQDEYDISTLKEKPPAKRPVQTILFGISHVDRIIERIDANIPHGSKVFWVTPCLEPSQRYSGSSAKERFEQLSRIFPGKVALLHGKMSFDEKERVMEQFSKKDAEISILVSTTVVEVGVDVPDASICIIDRAENFGLSQIHQIRGRIGRGDKPEREVLKECFCVLLYDDGNSSSSSNTDGEGGGEGVDNSLSPPAKLQILVGSNDGFEIAESDLKLRGPGDIFGFRQHGEAKYRVASLNDHGHLLGDAMSMAVRIANLEGEFAEYRNGTLPLNLCAVVNMFRRETEAGGMEKHQGQISKSVKAKVSPKKEPSVRERPENNPEADHVLELQGGRRDTTGRTGLSKSPLFKGFFLSPPVDITRDIVVLLDLETTGFLSDDNHIIQIACKVLGDNSKDAHFNCYVHPQVPNFRLSPFIKNLTGIDDGILKEQGRSFKHAFGELSSWIQTLKASRSGAKIIIAAHNGKKFDFAFIQQEIRRLGYSDTTDWTKELDVSALLDTLILLEIMRDKHGGPEYKQQKLSLGEIYARVKGHPPKNTHNAISDCQILEEVLLDENNAFIKIWREVAQSCLFPLRS